MSRPPRAAIYARVSSASQREARTIEAQLPACRELAARFGWDVVAEFTDDGISAAAGNLNRRLGLLKLLAAAEAGEFDMLVTYDEDRLTRSDRLRERGFILGSLQEAHIKIATVTKSSVIDLDTDEGDLAISFGGLRSSSWLRGHKARIKAGKARAIAEGRKPSGPTPYGHAYDRSKVGASGWSVDPIRGPVVIEIFERVAAGESTGRIGDDLIDRGIPRPRGSWSRERVYQIVRSRHPVGEWTVDKARRLTLKVPPIISEDLWQRAQDALLRYKRRGLRRTKHTYLLEGMGRCGLCGEPVHIRSSNQDRRGWWRPPAYVCRSRKLEIRGLHRCTADIVQTSDVDDRVWRALCRELEDPGLLTHIRDEMVRRSSDQRDWKADAAGYQRHLDRLTKVEGGIMTRYRRGLVSDEALDTELAAITRERGMVAGQLATASSASKASASVSEKLGAAQATLEALRTRLGAATPEQRRQLVSELVEPDSVVFRGRDVMLTLLVPKAAAAESLDVVSADAAGSRNVREQTLRIRTVA